MTTPKTDAEPLTAEDVRDAILEAQRRFGRMSKVPIAVYAAILGAAERAALDAERTRDEALTSTEAYRLGYDSGYGDAEKVWLERCGDQPATEEAKG